MKKSLGVVKLALALVFAATFFACFSITVNVYFPEKDVKSAFKTLEQELLKGTADGAEPQQPQTVPGVTPEAAPGPQGSILFEFGPSRAYAQDVGEHTDKQLVEKLKNDPAVVKAYREMGSRLGYIDRLRDTGVVGEGNNGMLKPRGEMGKKETVAAEEENANRRTIITAMAKAIVEVNNQPPTEENIKQVLDKAGAQFAGIRRDFAKPGWWIEKPDGTWAKK